MSSTSASAGYVYPDRVDHITAELIRSKEPFRGYWAASERRILRRMVEDVRPSVDAADRPRMLDAGSGDGRLLAYFDGLFAQIVVLEPDDARLSLARRRRNMMATEITFSSDRAEHHRSSDQYDLILCSHVAQHVATDILPKMLRRFRSLLRPLGLLALLAAHSTRGTDFMVQASCSDGRSIEEEINKRRFDELAGAGSEYLPIRFLTARSIRALLRTSDFAVHRLLCYHALDVTSELPLSLERDRYINRSLARQARFGRDMYVLARPLPA